jgi:hypothetical protein
MTIRVRVYDLLSDDGVGGWVFDQRKYAVGHEPSRANGGAAAGHLSHLNDAASRVDLYPTTVASRDYVVGADLVARIYDDLDPVAAHT